MDIIPAYQSPSDREREAVKAETPELLLNAWNVQNIVYELIANNYLSSDPRSLGFNFSQKFSFDKTKSEVLIDIGFNWKPDPANKRPAIFVTRATQQIETPTMKAEIVGGNSKESQSHHFSMNKMQVIVKCLATNVGMVESLAEFVKQPLLFYQNQIQHDFKFRQFRLKTISQPEIYVESNDHLIINLGIDTVFDEGWMITGDDLKLKTVARSIFDGITTRPIPNQ